MTIFSKSHPLHKLISGAAVAGVAALLISFCVQFAGRMVAEKEMAAWKARADSATVVAQAQQDSANMAGLRADSLQGELKRQKSYGVLQDKRIAELIANVPEVPTVAPDTCLPWATRAKSLQIVVTAQSVRIDSLKEEVKTAEGVAEQQASKAAHLQTAKDSLQNVIDTFKVPQAPKRSVVTIGPGVGVTYVNNAVRVIPVVSVHIPISFKSVAKALLPF